jgi:hypothetical protein
MKGLIRAFLYPVFVMCGILVGASIWFGGIVVFNIIMG